MPWNLSWASGGRLAFFWTDDGPQPSSSSGLWLLDTRAAGNNLMPSRPILPQTVGADTVGSALITPDASKIIAAVTYDRTQHVGRGTVVGGIVELSTRTSRPLRTLLAERAAYSGDAGWFVTDCLLPSIDVTGNHLLVSCDRFGRLDRGRFTALPGAQPHWAVAAAW